MFITEDIVGGGGTLERIILNGVPIILSTPLTLSYLGAIKPFSLMD